MLSVEEVRNGFIIKAYDHGLGVDAVYVVEGYEGKDI